MRLVLIVCLLSTVMMVGGSGEALGQTLDIGQQKQLFIDDYFIESLDGVAKTLNQPTKYALNPVLPMVPQGQPSWDANMPIYFSSVIFDEDEEIFKMWYGLWAGGGDANSVLAYATSEDGIAWQKPSLEIFEYGGTTENNIVLNHGGLVSGVFKDVHEQDPAKRYKMLHMRSDYRVYASYSADGVYWNLYNGGDSVIYEAPGHDSHMVAYWDEGLGKYVAIIRDRTGWIRDVRRVLIEDEAARETWKTLWGPNRDPENHTIRRVGQAQSDDFVNWTPVRVIVGADSEDPPNVDQFYNMEVMQYEGLRIGFMTVFSDDPELNRGSVQLTYSRDGMNWNRGGDREVFLPLSDQPGDFDWGMIYPVQAPIVVGDEIYIYYSGMGYDHNHVPPDGISEMPNGIGLAKLRLDGFVSVDAGSEEGTLTTKPFVFSGKGLLFNAEGEHVFVEVLDEDGLPLPGFGKDDFGVFELDGFYRAAGWNGSPDLSSLDSQVIKLKFYLQDAQLYSLQVSPTVPGPALAGDFDLDGDVDGADFWHWQIGYPTASGATRDTGDADGDGDVDGIDFGLWHANYPTSVGSASTVPEPATLFVMVAASLPMLLRFRRAGSDAGADASGRSGL